jgi:hypothetical protein
VLRPAAPPSFADFRNGGDGAGARGDTPLAAGRHTFYLWARDVWADRIGFNVFLDGGDLAPDLSGRNMTGAANGLASSEGLSTFGLATAHTAPGAGLSFQTGGMTYTVASFAPMLTASSFYANDYFVGTTAAAQNVRVYKLELDVTGAATTTPEPATFALMAGGLVAIAGAVRVRRRG